MQARWRLRVLRAVSSCGRRGRYRRRTNKRQTGLDGMAIDMKAFHEMFFAECEEFLDLARAQIDGETVDIKELHRCVHSIKGGADTFGFAGMAALAGALEGVLQLIKDERTSLDTEIIVAAKAALVTLREQLSSLRSGHMIQPNACATLISRLAVLRKARESGVRDAETMTAVSVFDLRFVIGRLVVGGDVLVEDMLASLADLGEIRSVCRPSGADGNPVWHVSVASTHAEGDLRAVLERIAEPESLHVELRTDAGLVPPADTGVAEPVVCDVCAGDDPPGETSSEGVASALTAEAAEGVLHPYLTFLVGDQLYAIQACRVIEVRPHDSVTRIAGLPDWVLGVVSFDGEFVPVVDLRVLLGVGGVEPSGLEAQLCVKAVGCSAALAVGDVGEVLLLAQHRVRSVPHPVADVARYIEGFAAHDGRVLVVLELAALLAAASIRPVRAEAFDTRLAALNAVLNGLRSRSLEADAGRVFDPADLVDDEPVAGPAVGELHEPVYDKLLEYLEDAVGTGRTALLLSRDLDCGLGYPEQTRSLLALMLGWIAETLIGLDRYVERPAGARAGTSRATSGKNQVGSGDADTQPRPVRIKQRGATPLPKIGGGAGSDRAIADEWESTKK